MKFFSLILLICSYSIFASSKFQAQPIKINTIPPQHPFMGLNGSNNMHNDSYISNINFTDGPTNPKAKIHFFGYSSLAGQCPSFSFDSRGNLLTVCAKANKTELLLLDPTDLKVIDRFSLPAREGVLPAITSFSFNKLMNDTSGGAYFYLDDLDRVVLATSQRKILIIGQRQTNQGIKFDLQASYDLNPYVPSNKCPTVLRPKFHDPNCDKITTVLPDWEGHYWFITRFGRIGTIDPATKKVRLIKLQGEEIQNSFAMSEDSAFIISDYHLYRMKKDSMGFPKIVWKQKYDRGVRNKPGQINQGSGTTPTLIGNDYVAIADNADPQMNILIYKRNEMKEIHRIVCKVPVFKLNRSATENTLIGFNNSIIVGNNYGYESPFQINDTESGMARIDIQPDGKSCKIVWENNVDSLTNVPKFSSKLGIIYMYTRKEKRPIFEQTWYLSGIDYKTGKEVISIPTGKGLKFNNNWSAITLNDKGEAFIGTFNGFIKVTN